MSITCEELNATNCRTYLLVDGKEAALVDPVRERLELYRSLLAERGLSLRYIIETHTHADHLMFGDDAKNTLGAPVLMHTRSPSPTVDQHIEDGATLPLGLSEIGVLYTPGHTPDSVSLLVDSCVLTGDVLLINGSGRTDFMGGDPGQSYDSITQKLFTLPDETIVWPGHDYNGRASSTIGQEKAGNARLAGKSREQYIDIMNNLGLPLPERIQRVLQVNQTGYSADDVGGFPSIHDVDAVPEVSATELITTLEAQSRPLVLDVREPEEFVGALGHIGGALLVPVDSLVRRLPKLAGYVDRDIVVVCRAGSRSRTAGALLRRAGFRSVRNLTGGMLAWNEAGHPTER